MNRNEADKNLSGQRIESTDDLFYWLRYIGATYGYWPIVDFQKVCISKYLSKRARESAYVEFDIPKKTGGGRHIVAPNSQLKAVQSCINILLQAIYEPHECATGFICGRGVKSNAERHIGSSCMLNIDLKDFFPSVTKDMVRRALKEELSERIPSAEVRNMICSLCTIPTPDGTEVLPQGAPTSPVLSNIVLKRLDRRLAAFAGAHGYNYTRYADDITFSHDRDFSNGVHADLKSVISGKINYLTMIRGKEDWTARNYAKQFSKLCNFK